MMIWMNLNRGDIVKQIIYKCLNNECSCEFKGKNEDGLRCPKCKSSIGQFNLNPTDEELAKVFSYKKLKSKPYETGLVVTVSLTNTEQFKQAVSLLSELLKDNRISKELRSEYGYKFKRLVNISKE